MQKSRINKCIFTEANVFLRVKTTAEDLVFKKEGEGYSIEFSNEVTPAKSIVGVVLIKDVDLVPTTNAGSEDYPWGRLVKEKTFDPDSPIFYYAVPKSNDYAVKFGPFYKDILESSLEIDWLNLQWGSISK